MPELSMAAGRSDQLPAIVFEQANDFAYLHARAGYLGDGIRRITDQGSAAWPATP